jgi:hypothetical protein
MCDHAVFVDHVRDSFGVAVAGRFAGTVRQADLVIGIAQKRELVAKFFGEGLIFGFGVEAAA